MVENRRALVVGSEGNIGVPLVKYLKSLGYEVLEVDVKPAWRDNYIMADITNAVDILPALDWRPDVIFMLSAMVSRVTCEQAAALAVNVNLTGLQNMLELAKRAGAHFVYFSTSEVYGNDLEFMDESAVPTPNNRYGLTKLLGESLVEYEVAQHGLSAVTLRPFMMYDEDEDLGDHRSAMIRFVTDLYQGKEIEVHGGSARAWFHVSDAVRSIEAAAHVSEYTIINIGSDDVRSIEELAFLICDELDADRALVRTVDLPNRMTLIKQPNLQRQRDILGVVPKVVRTGPELVCGKMTERMALEKSNG